MTDANANRWGSVENGDDGSFANDWELFLKVWSGEVINAFAETNLLMPLHMVRTIANGKTAQFPVGGKASAEYHTAGKELLGLDIPYNEVTINIDNPLITHAFIANMDEAVSHFDVKSQHTNKMARALSKQADQYLCRVACLAARSGSPVTGIAGGDVIEAGSSVATDADDLYAAIFDAQRIMDEKDVPENDRVCLLRPAQYSLLAQSTLVHSSDWGGTGTIAKGNVLELAGFTILKTNNLPSTNIAAPVAGENNDYTGDFTKTVAACFQREAFGTVKLRDLAMESEYQVSRQGTLLVAKYMMGHGILRGDCAVEISSDTP